MMRIFTQILTTTRGAARRGFSLIEMLVVVAIMILITGAILVNSNQMGGQFILGNFTYDMALTLREAQQYGIAVRSYSGNFNVAYGVRFDSANPTTYILFADAVDPNGMYDAGELVQSYEITRNFRISNICTQASGTASEVCSMTNNRVDILFKRPEPDAWISSNGASCRTNIANCQFQARIVLVSPRGQTKSVVAPANGQISVQ